MPKAHTQILKNSTAMKAALIPFLFLPFLLSAQKYTLRGTLGDTTAQPIVGATVMLLSPKDSALIAFTRSNADGVWDFKNQSSGEYLLRATYFGYKNHQQLFSSKAPNL